MTQYYRSKPVRAILLSAHEPAEKIDRKLNDIIVHELLLRRRNGHQDVFPCRGRHIHGIILAGSYFISAAQIVIIRGRKIHRLPEPFISPAGEREGRHDVAAVVVIVNIAKRCIRSRADARTGEGVTKYMICGNVLLPFRISREFTRNDIRYGRASAVTGRPEDRMIGIVYGSIQNAAQILQNLLCGRIKSVMSASRTNVEIAVPFTGFRRPADRERYDPVELTGVSDVFFKNAVCHDIIVVVRRFFGIIRRAVQFGKAHLSESFRGLFIIIRSCGKAN